MIYSTEPKRYFFSEYEELFSEIKTMPVKYRSLSYTEQLAYKKTIFELLHINFHIFEKLMYDGINRDTVYNSEFVKKLIVAIRNMVDEANDKNELEEEFYRKMMDKFCSVE